MLDDGFNENKDFKEVTMVESYKEPRCSVCRHPDIDKINELLLAGERTQKSIAEEFGLVEASLSNHKNSHALIDFKEKLREIALRGLSRRLDCKSVGELIETIKLVEKFDEKNCELCAYKINAIREKRTLGDVIREYLEQEENVESTKVS